MILMPSFTHQLRGQERSTQTTLNRSSVRKPFIISPQNWYSVSSWYSRLVMLFWISFNSNLLIDIQLILIFQLSGHVYKWIPGINIMSLAIAIDRVTIGHACQEGIRICYEIGLFLAARQWIWFRNFNTWTHSNQFSAVSVLNKLSLFATRGLCRANR
jgi:hypothetical protein